MVQLLLLAPTSRLRGKQEVPAATEECVRSKDTSGARKTGILLQIKLEPLAPAQRIIEKKIINIGRGV